MKWVALLLTGLFASACVTRPASAPVTSSRFEQKLVLAASSAEEMMVREQALNLLGLFGTETVVEPIAALCADERSEVRSDALGALGCLGWQHPALAALVLPHLRHGLHDGVESCRLDALQALGMVPGDDWQDVEAMLADASASVRITAAMTLARNGVPMHPRDVAMVLRDAAATYMHGRLVNLFALLREESDRELLAPYLQSANASVRFRAAEAWARIAAIAVGASADWQAPSQRVREQYQRENAAAMRRLQAMTWTGVGREEVLAAVAASRLVLFGEMHSGDGPLRQAQREVLRAMVAGPGRVVLGYEPSVQRAQQSVLDLAQELGVEVIAVESDWQHLLTESRYAERDDQAVAAINACFAKDPGCRMLVIRGEGHTTPDGYLAARLVHRPLVLLSVQMPTFAVIGDGPFVGRTFRIGERGSIYYWGVTDPLEIFPKLAAWLAGR